MMGSAYNLDVLRGLPLFSSLGQSELAALLPSVQRRSYPARSFILRAGEPADGLYILLSGRVKVVTGDGEGRELIVSMLGPNEFFGELGLIEGGARTTSVHSHEPCEVLQVTRKAMVECLQENAAVAMAMLRTVVDRLQDAHRRIESLALFDVYGRVAGVLTESGHEANGEWLVDPGSQQIAAMVGASREMVSRVIKDMIHSGLVRRRKRKLIVLNRDSLADRRSYGRHTLVGKKKDALTASKAQSSRTHI
jgi:CRP/FNR family cyclic AMP-dependent transcriptional regulator